ncbi:hypothetical protein [Iodobacter fluviatilis]|uniref:Uncharacterized protein n=2 Tax=Iodobacter fluviatilis TaxID=537 RepID=A0A377Q889_9NEIS|nr:hypothetical protein [Iodobacter fluviatilis]TCU89419.1 hypothetical protein EV682_102331 [Iodobacter fluviatilis]STQ90789.1 Uncharacterised protein [Iodobacter fluviatilis]
MVLLAISPKGLADALRISAKTGEAVWCGSEAVTESEFNASMPARVTRFVYGLTGDSATLLDDALETIAEHHPAQTIWVESAPGAA